MNDYVTLLWDAMDQYKDQTAIVDQGGQRNVDYATVKNLMLATASWIYSKKIEPDSYIPVRFESSYEYVAVVCGIWLSGHAAVFVGKSFPDERVKYISMNCDAPFVIDDTVLEEIKKTTIVDISLFPEQEKNVAFLLYTSGSTGMPKGILHTFDGLLSAREMGNKEIYSTGQKWAMGAPMYFVASIAVYKVLTFGGCVHLISPEIMRDVKKLEDYYDDHQITVGFISPSVLKNFHNRAKSLKLIMTGSERLSGQCSKDGYKLYNNYGMSETLGTICSFLVDEPYETTPVGIPRDEVEWALLDENGKPVADGEEGEMCVKGSFTLGYFKNPEATSELFKGGWLHTGDILKKLPDGNLVYINRKDWMVKINGQRVEPGEIENVIREMDEVQETVVKAIKGFQDSVFLCAYYTGEKMEEDYIKEFLSKRIAEYMIPTFYIHLDKFPINPNGKIDRKNLPEPDLKLNRAQYASPENEVQSVLCRAFESALGVEQIGIDDDFFMLGGDSIKVMKLMTLCPDLALTSKVIYAEKTPRKIGEVCEKNGALKERVKKNEYPLTGTQLGIYIESMNREGEACYNNPILLNLGEGIDAAVLAKAVEAAVEAHPFIKLKLKTNADGEVVQQRNEDEIYHQDVEKISESELLEKAHSLMKPFYLLKDSLFRIRIFDTGKNVFLFIDLHHIIFDGTSMIVFMKDIERAYLGGNVEPETYSGFEIAEDEASVDEEAYENAKQWYLDTFGGLEIDSLPIPNMVKDEPCFSAIERDVVLESTAVEAECRKYNVTENIYMTAAFGVLLGLYSGMTEALFTTIYNGRDSLKTARTVAMLVKTLPVYTKFSGNQDIREYLESVKVQLLGSMNNDIYSFANISADTGITGDILFAYQGDLLDVGMFANRQIKRIPIMENATGEKLAFQMFKKDGIYNIRAEYRSDLYSEEFIDILLRSFENVLQKMLSAKKVRDISLASYKDIEILNNWNNTQRDYDKTQTVVTLFNSAAEKYADNIAVIFKDISLTYKEVNEYANRIAAYINSKNIGVGDVVAILIEKGIYQVIASLGALKAGCTYMPLDPTYPVERLQFMIDDADAKLLIADGKLRDSVSNYKGDVLFTDDVESLPKGECKYVGKPDDLFILLYTSGSTGVPKGVKLTHRNLVCFIDWYIRYTELTSKDVASQYASYGFDACMLDMYPTLAAGAALCIVPEDMRLDLDAVNKYYIENRVTMSFMTTQVGRQFAAEMKNPYLRAILVGGEKLASMDPPENISFINIYGPTECTICVTSFLVEKKENNIPIGKPMENVKLYVIDQFGHLLPPGALGELLIAGPHVGIGYLNQPDRTKEVFIENPFDTGEYASAYKSGDVVRYRPDGNIEFIGRRDGQVKIHGFRIELSEVEAVIREYEGIRDVAVIAKDLGDDGKAIYAYFVSDEKIESKDIAAFIKTKKPPYMVPSAIMQIDQIPLNQNGKVNKKALPEPKIIEDTENTNHVDNVLEKELKKIIGEAVNIENPPLNIPLEYIGFNSINMIRLAAKLSKQFGIKIPFKEIKDMSIAMIADSIIENWMNGVNNEGAKPVEKVSQFELSSAQAGIYIECMKEPDNTSYNIPSVMFFEKDMSTSILKNAVNKVLKANPSLFVHFGIIDKQIMAIYDEQELPEIPVFEYTQEEFETFKAKFVLPFHLNKGLLFRFAIVKTTEYTALFCDFHHLVFDGFSMNLFIDELGYALNKETPTGESMSYNIYVNEQKKLLEGEEKAKYDNYFGNLLKDYESATELPTDANASSDTHKKGFEYFEINQETVDNVCNRTKVTEAGFYLAALDYTLARMTASENVHIATISSGRSDARFAYTFGMFVNTIPLVSKLGDGTTDEYIKEVAAGLKTAVEHENYPFAEVSARWGYSVSIMYEYQRGIVEKVDVPKLTGIEALEFGKAKFKLTIRIVDRNGKPTVEVEYDDAEYKKESIDTFIKIYATVINNFSNCGETKLREISLLNEEERKKLDSLRERDVKPSFSSDTLFHTGIEKNAKENPDKLALTAVDGDYTYFQIDSNANRVANGLILRGIKPKDRVVILLPRCAKIFFAIFGILKAGATYIPCDPNYPTERVRYIIEDSNATLIITSSDMLKKFTDKAAVDIEALLEENNENKPNVNISQDDLAYMIYTSGSTGNPKGVMIRHRGAVNYVTNTKGNILVNGMVERGHVMTAITTFSFDFSIKEWAAPLFNGLTLSVASDDEINDASKLAQRIISTDTDMFGSTPSRLLTLLGSEEFSKAFEKVKIVICGGEKYPDSLLAILKKQENRMIFNTYGPTEITVSSNTADLTNEDRIHTGRPLPGVIEFIVDNDGNELPVGVVGELYIGGMGVAAGYNNLPEMTKERFVEYQGHRIYKSGDYARWTPEGYVEILGRKDNQIKLRGLRIELDEVESVLGAVEGIERTAVKIEKLNGIEHLCAWFTASHKVDIGALKKELGKKLTNYMVPTAYMQLEKMPFTPNGKLDLKNLPTPELFRDNKSAAASTPAEKAFCEIFSNILHIEKVGVLENFFDLGGTSLLVTVIVIEAGKKGYTINFKDVFDNPTPKALAEIVEKTNSKEVQNSGIEGISGYDYSRIDKLLEKNTLESFKKGELRSIGNVLLTGAVGYLGIHILHELLSNKDKNTKIYCLLRPHGNVNATKRLMALYFYYFSQSIEHLIGNQLLVVEGDITESKALESIEDMHIDTVINCAAVVKHFSTGTLIEDVNYGGVLNLIDFCLKTKATLIQTSTMSVVSEAFKDAVEDHFIPDEKSLYIGQPLDNKYVHSKFIAERAVLEAVATKGLQAKIMRLGNLAPRDYDGEFQINADTNSAMGRLKSFIMLGCASYDQLGNTMEFSPINAVAKAIVLLSKTPEECTVFHVFNDRNISYENIFRELTDCGYPIKYVEREEFAKVFEEAENDPDKAKILTSIMAYMRPRDGKETVMLQRQCGNTVQILYRLGFCWPITTWDYISRFVITLSGLGFLDKSDMETS